MKFIQLTLTGKDAAKFLQGQLTCDVTKLGQYPTPCAICNLQGRVQFGLWVAQADDESYTLITAADMAEALMAHLKKYGAFSKFTTSDPIQMYPTVVAGTPSFSDVADLADDVAWATASIEVGNAWVDATTTGLYQPQELRLHQRGGVDYDKGCYLGQEIVARLYFKSAPKSYLHRVRLSTPVVAGDKLGKVSVVNAISDGDGAQALVVGAPDEVAALGQILPLPDALMGSVARQV